MADQYMRSFTLLALLLAPSLAEAATVLALDEAALVARADTIVVGSIISTRVVRTPGGVMTEGDLQVYRGLRGAEAGTVITIAVPGGRVAKNLIADVAGAPKLQPGQLVFAFLETWGYQRRPLGLSLGFIEVKSVSGVMRVFRNLEGVQAVGPTDPNQLVIAGELFTDFLARIEALVAKAPLSPDKSREVRP
jgi:hypothetical protein